MNRILRILMTFLVFFTLIISYTTSGIAKTAKESSASLTPQLTTTNTLIRAATSKINELKAMIAINSKTKLDLRNRLMTTEPLPTVATKAIKKNDYVGNPFYDALKSKKMNVVHIQHYFYHTQATQMRGLPIEKEDLSNSNDGKIILGNPVIPQLNSEKSTSAGASEISENMLRNEMKKTKSISRPLSSDVEGLDITLVNTPSDLVSSEDSRIVKGKTTPGAYVRVTGDPALPTPVLSSGVEGERYYSTKADTNGNFEVKAPEGQYFTAANEIKVYASFNGQVKEATIVVEDKTAPTAEGLTLTIEKGSKLPNAYDFLYKIRDSNPTNKTTTHIYWEDYTALPNQVGTYDVFMGIYDTAKNIRKIPAKLIVVDKLAPMDITLSNKPSDLVTSEDSQIIKGRTTPGAYVRVTGDAALPTPALSSEVAGEENYSTKADANGDFEVRAQEGQYFTASNEIKVHAMLNGKVKEVRITVADKTAPTADGLAISIEKGSKLPNAYDFLYKVRDSNPMNNTITHTYWEDYTALPNQVGTYDVFMKIYDTAKNIRKIPAKLIVVDKLAPMDISVSNKPNDLVTSEDSRIIKGKTTPGAYVRVTGDAALPTPALSSGVAGEDNYSTKADNNGNFEVEARPNTSFTASTSKVKIYAFLVGQSKEIIVPIEDKTGPTGDGVTLTIVKGDKIPNARDFMKNMKDSNPENKSFQHYYEKDYSYLSFELGLHDVNVILTDGVYNKTVIPAGLEVLGSKYSLEADEVTVSLSKLKNYTTVETLKAYLLNASNAQSWGVENYAKIDLRDKIQVDSLNNIQQLKPGQYTIKISVLPDPTNLSSKINKNFTVNVLNDSAVSPTNPENPGGGAPVEQENNGTGQTGLLKLDYAPSTFDFGTVKFGFDSVDKHAIKTTSDKQWLQVSDNRLSKDITNWSVQVAQNHPLQSIKGEEIKGATISIPKGKKYNEHYVGKEIISEAGPLISKSVDISTTPTVIFKSNITQGKMTDISTDVWNTTDVSLHIPGNQIVNYTNYSNTINWTLVAEP